MERHQLITQEIAHSGIISGTASLLELLEQNRITSEKELPPMDFMLRLFNEPCFPRREIVAVTGRAKSGKTFIMSMIMTCCVAREVLSFRRETPEPLRVLWYDTEQSDNSTQDILRNRIIPLYQQVTGEEEFPEDLFDIFNVRNINREQRRSLFRLAVEHFHPDLVILDGIRDLVADINDVVTAQDIMEELMKTAQSNECCIICVLHQNKMGDSRDPRGHLGTELLNKAYDVFASEKLMPQKIFKLEQLYTRKYDIEQSLFFGVDDHGLPFPTEAPPMFAYMSQTGYTSQEERPSLNDSYVIRHSDDSWEMDVERLFTDAFQGYETLTGAALRNSVKTLGHIATNSLYNNCLDKAMKMNLMIKTNDNKKRVIYRLNLPTPRPVPQQRSLWEYETDSS